ncbi:MAG: PAS domain S-box protein [Ferruginibacter sp.]|nr:PAS domain S-box protein [Cytophagales bacterium]
MKLPAFQWEFDSRLLARLRTLSRILAYAALLLGLAEWLSGLLGTPHPAATPVNALGLGLAAASLLLPVNRVGRATAGAVALLGTGLFGAGLLGTTPAPGFVPSAGGISASVSLLLFSVSFLSLHASKPRYGLGQVLAYAMLPLTYVALAGYLFGGEAFANRGLFFLIPPFTSLGLACLALALLFRHPDRGITTVVSSVYAGSRHARPAFRAMFISPLVMVTLIVLVSQHYAFPLEFGIVLFCGLHFSVSVVGAYFNYQQLNRFDAQRTHLLRENETINQTMALANEEMRAMNEELHAASEEHNAINEVLTEANGAIRALMTEKLSQSEQKFQELTESITDMFLAVDHDLRYVYWNRVCERRTGLSSENVLGKTIYEVFPIVQDPATEGWFLPTLQDRRKRTYEAQTTWNGSNRHLGVSVFPSRIGLSVLLEDITEKKIKENEILQLNQQLTERNHELDQIVYKISHDLRAPLTSVLGLISLMKLPTQPDEMANYLHLQENRVQKLDRFIQSMLDFSRNTRTKVVTQPVDFTEIIEQCQQDLAYMPHFSRIDFRIAIDGGPFHCDPFRLKILFLNVMSNAIKYQHLGHQQAFLKVWVSVASGQATLRFEDNGIGIEQAHLPRIFEMFFRATQQAEGSGLGMYIVKQTVDKLSGTVQLTSVAGQGTQLTVHLPDLTADQSDYHPAGAGDFLA